MFNVISTDFRAPRVKSTQIIIGLYIQKLHYILLHSLNRCIEKTYSTDH